MPVDPKSKPEFAADPSAALGQFWAQWMEQSARGTQALLEAMEGAADPEVWQKRWLSAMEEYFEGFLRSPSYLEGMRRSLKTITDAKLAQDELIHNTARHLGLPLAADISGLFDRLHGTETAILGRLTAIEDRLEAIEASLAAGAKTEAEADDDHDSNGNGSTVRRRPSGGRGKSTK